jgi:hypothetical protein
MTIRLVTGEPVALGLLRSAHGLAPDTLRMDARSRPRDGDLILIHTTDGAEPTDRLRFHLRWSRYFSGLAVRREIALTLVNWVSATDPESLAPSVVVSALDQFARMVAASPEVAGVTPVTIGAAASEFGGPASVAILNLIDAAPRPLAGRTVKIAGGVVGIMSYPELVSTVTTLKPRWEPGDISQAVRVLLTAGPADRWREAISAQEGRHGQ